MVAENLVPGVMRCAKCEFQLVRTNLYVNSGTTGPGDSKTEPCPNGCGPLWPVTWKQWAEEAQKTAERFFEEAKAERAKLDEMAMLVRRLVHSLKRIKPDSELPAQAMDYLRRHGLQGSPLRESPTQETPADLVGALQDKVHADSGPFRAGRAVKETPAVPACEKTGAPAPAPERTGYERMFHSAVAALAEISDALGIPEDVASTANGNAEILHAIAELKARASHARDALREQRRERLRDAPGGDDPDDDGPCPDRRCTGF